MGGIELREEFRSDGFPKTSNEVYEVSITKTFGDKSDKGLGSFSGKYRGPVSSRAQAILRTVTKSAREDSGMLPWSEESDSEESDSEDEKEPEWLFEPFEPLMVWRSPHQGGVARGLPLRL